MKGKEKAKTLQEALNEIPIPIAILKIVSPTTKLVGIMFLN